MNKIRYSSKKEKMFIGIAFLLICISILIILYMFVKYIILEGLEPIIEYNQSDFCEVEAQIINESKVRDDYVYKCEYIVGDNEYIAKIYTYFKEKGDTITLKYNPENPSQVISGKLKHEPNIETISMGLCNIIASCIMLSFIVVYFIDPDKINFKLGF